MTDFSDRPFVAGVVTGLRAFRIDTLGRLTGVTYKDVWTPGENAAVCHRSDSPMAQQANAMVAQLQTLSRQLENAGFDRRGKKAKSIPQIPTPREKAAAVAGDHALAGVLCQCGFYAYFDGGNDYLTDSSGGFIAGGMYTTTTMMFGPSEPDRAPRVAAIVNGWGLVTVGTRGFRAAKAEVVALISPASERARHEVAFAKVRANYPGLALFETEQQAVREFPLTDPNPFSPETDPDFWTRSAS